MTTTPTSNPGASPLPSELRAELEDMIVRDLLGPIGGERERTGEGESGNLHTLEQGRSPS